jgi:hypothetical protein
MTYNGSSSVHSLRIFEHSLLFIQGSWQFWPKGTPRISLPPRRCYYRLGRLATHPLQTVQPRKRPLLQDRAWCVVVCSTGLKVAFSVLMAKLEGRSLLFVFITRHRLPAYNKARIETSKPRTPLSCCELLLQGHVIEHQVATVTWIWNFCLLGVMYVSLLGQGGN